MTERDRSEPGTAAEDCLDTEQLGRPDGKTSISSSGSRAGTGRADASTTTAAPVAPAEGPEAGGVPLAGLLGYLALGVYLGVVFMQSEVVSWFRIQEMFRFQSFHMYGIIGTAVGVAALSVQVIERLGLRTVRGDPIRIAPKQWGRGRIPGARYWLGGTIFGMGWAFLGACPGPIFALLGGGITVIAVALAAALLGTWTYAALRPRLPH